jgi:hypothetical protein
MTCFYGTSSKTADFEVHLTQVCKVKNVDFMSQCKS